MKKAIIEVIFLCGSVLLILSCRYDYCESFGELYLSKSCDLKVDTLYQVSPNHEFAIGGIGRDGKRDTLQSSKILDLYSSVSIGDRVIKRVNETETRLIKPNETLIFNYECKDKSIYLNGEQVWP
jgi:hypothetical protein